MGNRSYGEACRFAYALDLVGERWALLVVRELLLGPKRFTDLREGLSQASTNILSERLRELEQAGVIQRRKLEPPAGSWVYELTEWGRELEPVVTKLGAWGARAPSPPEAHQIGSDSIVLALRSLFDPGSERDQHVDCGLRLGEDRFHVRIDGERLELGRGAVEETDIAIDTDPGTLAAVISKQLTLNEAVSSEAMRIEGGKQAVARFLRHFPMPSPSVCDSAGAAMAGAKA